MQDTIITTAIANKNVVCDTAKTQIVDSLSRIISENVTLEALKNSEAFYSDAFDKIQESFSLFMDQLSAATVIASIVVSVLIAVLTYLAQKEKKDLKKELKEDFSGFEKRLTEKYNDQIEKIEMWHKKQKESFESWLEKIQRESENAIKEVKDAQELVNTNTVMIAEHGILLNKFEERLKELEKIHEKESNNEKS